MSETSGFDISPEQHAAIEDLADKRGISLEMAQRAFFGLRVEPGGPVAAPKEPRLHRTGHVHDYESDRDHDLAAERAQYAPPTDEDRAAAEQGLANLQPFRDKLEIDNAIRQNDEAFSDPDPYDRVKYAEAKQRDLNARMRKIYEKRATRAS